MRYNTYKIISIPSHAIQQDIAATLKKMKLDDISHDRAESKARFLFPKVIPKRIHVFFHGLTSSTSNLRAALEKSAEIEPDTLFIALPLSQHTSRDGLPKMGKDRTYARDATYLAALFKALKEKFELPIDILGVSAGSTLITSILTKLDKEVFNKINLLAPYYTISTGPTSHKKVEQLFKNNQKPDKKTKLVGWIKQKTLGIIARRGLFKRYLNRKVTPFDPQEFPKANLTRLFDLSYGQCCSLHRFAQKTVQDLRKQTLKNHFPHHVTMHLSNIDNVIDISAARKVAQRMGASVTMHDTLNHNMLCMIRNEESEVETLLSHHIFAKPQVPLSFKHANAG